MSADDQAAARIDATPDEAAEAAAAAYRAAGDGLADAATALRDVAIAALRAAPLNIVLRAAFVAGADAADAEMHAAVIGAAAAANDAAAAAAADSGLRFGLAAALRAAPINIVLRAAFVVAGPNTARRGGVVAAYAAWRAAALDAVAANDAAAAAWRAVYVDAAAKRITKGKP